ncbi:LOW QUALITY PROTEIN: Alpha-1,3-mannosyltransferase [Phytophthora palmivora]|uniref:Alpha-1,3/1,6-mannosyltransferase ALG2 n=1 Tax=Phytophthora palmivora TaxID=4796 RepID=A0A2P4YSI9_9STRA|nr:LOW QUALITY PROTEIN: Alpha-1,3-mannosyltransferase [Phytophthora palmivora]
MMGLHRPRKSFGNTKSPLRVGFIHPDFGIGGAENLVVNTMLALQKKGVTVSMFTAHHDKSHCFEETRGDEPLAKGVFVFGDWLPKNIFGKLHALCTVVRMAYVTLVITIKYLDNYDAFFIDQISITILFYGPLSVFFYGHFPDKVQSNTNGSTAKAFYRVPFDFLEEITTACADVVVANSNFSRSMFEAALPRTIARKLEVLYPPVDIKAFSNFTPLQPRNPNLFVSLNRIERRKNIIIAIKALAIIQQTLSPSEFQDVKLVIAGGYDPNNVENHDHLRELQTEAAANRFENHIEFCTSVTDVAKKELLATAQAVLYTPSNEHFGIVPVEAMTFGTPVIAVNNGGPMETVENGKTGFLCESSPQSFAGAMLQLLGSANSVRAECMGQAGKERAFALFSLETFSDQLMKLVAQML